MYVTVQETVKGCAQVLPPCLCVQGNGSHIVCLVTGVRELSGQDGPKRLLVVKLSAIAAAGGSQGARSSLVDSKCQTASAVAFDFYIRRNKQQETLPMPDYLIVPRTFVFKVK